MHPSRTGRLAAQSVQNVKLISARSGSLSGAFGSPDLKVEPWDPPEIADVNADHGVPCGDGLRAKPKIVSADRLSGGSQLRPETSMRPGRRQIYVQEGQMRKDAFHPGFPPCPCRRGCGPVNPVQEFTCRNDR